MSTGACMAEWASNETRSEILSQVPQQKPFRFIDSIEELSADHVVGTYTFQNDEYFYSGHFPGNPVTPGVVLTEAMAQIGLVPLALYLMKLDNKKEIKTTLFTDAQVEFSALVPPGAKITVRSEKIFWRRGKLQARVEAKLPDGKVAASGVLSGLGV